MGAIFGKPSKSKSTQTSSSSNQAYGQLSSAFSPVLGTTAAGSNWLGQILGIPGYGAVPQTNPVVPNPIPVGAGTAGGGGVNSITTGNGSTFDGGEQPGIQPGTPRLVSHLLGHDVGNNPLVGQNLQTGVPATQGATLPSVTGSPQMDAMSNYADSAGMKFLLGQGINQINGNMAGKGLLQSGATATGLEKLRQGLATTYLNQYLDKVLDFSRLGLGAGGVLAGAGQTSTSSGTSTSKGAKQGILGDIAGAAVSSAMGTPGGLI